jgi:hypothetical protein
MEFNIRLAETTRACQRFQNGKLKALNVHLEYVNVGVAEKPHHGAHGVVLSHLSGGVENVAVEGLELVLAADAPGMKSNAARQFIGARIAHRAIECVHLALKLLDDVRFERKIHSATKRVHNTVALCYVVIANKFGTVGFTPKEPLFCTAHLNYVGAWSRMRYILRFEHGLQESKVLGRFAALTWCLLCLRQRLIPFCGNLIGRFPHQSRLLVCKRGL